MSLDFSRLSSLYYIFSPNLLPFSENIARAFYFLFGLFLILSLAARLVVSQQEKKKNVSLRKLWQKLTTFFVTLGITGLLLLFFRQQRVYLLAMPLFLYLWLISVLVWLILIIHWAVVKMRKMQRETQERKEKEKYLP